MRNKQTDISQNIEKSRYNISGIYLRCTFLPNALSDEYENGTKTVEKLVDAPSFI